MPTIMDYLLYDCKTYFFGGFMIILKRYYFALIFLIVSFFSWGQPPQLEIYEEEFVLKGQKKTFLGHLHDSLANITKDVSQKTQDQAIKNLCNLLGYQEQNSKLLSEHAPRLASLIPMVLAIYENKMSGDMKRLWLGSVQFELEKARQENNPNAFYDALLLSWKTPCGFFEKEFVTLESLSEIFKSFQDFEINRKLKCAFVQAIFPCVPRGSKKREEGILNKQPVASIETEMKRILKIEEDETAAIVYQSAWGQKVVSELLTFWQGAL
jgi:hypothetical protein